MSIVSLTLSLSRAHKVAERLKAHANEVVAQACAAASPLALRSQQEASAPARVIERNAQVKELLNKHSVVINSLKNLRIEIARVNAEKGIDALLTQQNAISMLLSAQKKILEAASLNTALNWDQIPALTEEYARYSLAVFTQQDAQQLQKGIDALQAQLHRISDDVSDANRASVQIDLPESLAVVAGLIPPVA